MQTNFDTKFKLNVISIINDIIITIRIKSLCNSPERILLESKSWLIIACITPVIISNYEDFGALNGVESGNAIAGETLVLDIQKK